MKNRYIKKLSWLHSNMDFFNIVSDVLQRDTVTISTPG